MVKWAHEWTEPSPGRAAVKANAPLRSTGVGVFSCIAPFTPPNAATVGPSSTVPGSQAARWTGEHVTCPRPLSTPQCLGVRQSPTASGLVLGKEEAQRRTDIMESIARISSLLENGEPLEANANHAPLLIPPSIHQLESSPSMPPQPPEAREAPSSRSTVAK